MSASKATRARGNANLYLVLPALGTPALTGVQLSASYAELDRFAEVKTAPFQTTAGEIDTTNWDSGDWTDKLADIKSLTIPVAANLIFDATALPLLIEAYIQSKTVGFMHLSGDKPAVAAKNVAWVGMATILNYNQNESGVFEVTFGLSGKGAPNFYQGLVTYPKHDGTPGV